MQDKESIALTEEELFTIGDRNNLQFATMIRERIETTAARRGFARRLLVTELKGSSADTTEMCFDDCGDRAEQMRDQIVLMESNHYVREDRTLFERLRESLPKSQIIEASWNDFSPRLVAQARSIISDKLIPVTRTVFQTSFWNAIIGNDDFIRIFDPNTRHELIEQGFLGSSFGMSFESDAFAHPLLHFTEQGEMFFFGAPERFGKMQVLGRDDGVTVIDKRDGSTEWQIPHDFIQYDLNLDAVSLLRLS